MKRLTILFIVPLILVFLSSVNSVSAAVIQVPGEQPTIQAGIDAAVDGDTILLADGTYTGEGNLDLEGLEKGILLTSENGREFCVIDGGDDETVRIMEIIIPSDPFPVISGISFKRGGKYALLLDAEINFVDCLFEDNQFGIIYSGQNQALFQNCIFRNNSATYESPIYCPHSSTVFDNCLFTGNFNFNNPYFYAGALYISSKADQADSGPIVRNCTFRENYAEYGAGAVEGSSGDLVIENCLFENNSSGHNGGAMDYGAFPTRNCYFTGNHAVWKGGAVYNCGGRFEKCVFENNTADEGGAVYLDVERRKPKFDSCIFRNNTAEIGGAFSNRMGIPDIQNCVFHDNGYLYCLGGAIYLHTNPFTSPPEELHTFQNNIFYNNIAQDAALTIYWLNSPFSVSNSIFYGNSPSQISGPNSNVGFSVKHSLVQGGYPGYNIIDADPGFVAPYDFHLLPDSPCIDAGLTSLAPATDYDGTARPNGFETDIGIYETDNWSAESRPYVRMPGHVFNPGDPCNCTVTVYNAGSSPIENQPLFVILEVADLYFFAPGFSNFDFFQGSYSDKLTEITILEPFTWPEGAGTGTARWLAAFTDPDITTLTSPLEIWDFSWQEE